MEYKKERALRCLLKRSGKFYRPKIIDGPHAGETGWMLVAGEGDDGVPIDQFDGAVMPYKDRR
jgi:hypothetical protein